ncbi:DUF4260 domain-containing protein [Sulfitobacter sp.]|uniref:DUF4260 domain-containing protein n=1 Tax=Sulfitobacter sp. TaxID=1903071 RepID=UPI003F6B91F0
MSSRSEDTSPIKGVLRAEGAAIAALGLWLYAMGGHSWGLLAVLILAPDLAMTGYARGPRAGAICYNLAHSYVTAAAVLVVGLWTGSDTAMALGLIWGIHIGADRALGYGLKYQSGFKDTHLERV